MINLLLNLIVNWNHFHSDHFRLKMTSDLKFPSPKSVVELLMKKEREENLTVDSRNPENEKRTDRFFVRMLVLKENYARTEVYMPLKKEQDFRIPLDILRHVWHQMILQNCTTFTMMH